MKKQITYQFQSTKLVIKGDSHLVNKNFEINSYEILSTLQENISNFDYFITSEYRIEILSNIEEVLEYCLLLFYCVPCYHVNRL